MIGSRISYSTAGNPRRILIFGLENAVLLAILGYAFVITAHGKHMGASGLLLAICCYVLYAAQQHRRVFVLGRAPSLGSIAGGYCGGKEGFWKFMKETETSLDALEASFWHYYGIPPVILVGGWVLVMVEPYFK